MRGFGLGAFVAALVSATPAAAADIATLNCVRDNITAPVRAEILLSAEALASGKTAVATPELRAGLDAAAATCAARHGWSNNAREAARTYALVSVTLDSLRSVATKANVPLDTFALALKELTDTQRGQILNQDGSGIEALMEALAKRGISVEESEKGSVVGTLAVIMIVEEQQKALFIAS